MVLQLFCNNVHRRDASLIDLGTINYEENRRSTFRCQTTVIYFYNLNCVDTIVMHY